MWGLGGALLWSAALVFYDFRERRLPDILTLPVAGAALTWAWLEHPAALVGVLWTVLYVIVGLLLGGIGGGDVKLSVSLGIAVVAFAGVGWLFGAMISAAALTAVMLTLRGQQTGAHGPAMLAAAWAVTMLSAAVSP